MARSRLQKWVIMMLVVMMTLPILSACGKKSKPIPPFSEKKSDFPRKYPSY
jgi:hypothetical protein